MRNNYEVDNKCKQPVEHSPVARVGLWILTHLIAPLGVLLIVAVVVYYADFGGIRSACVTNAAGEIERAVQYGVEHCASTNPLAYAALGKASDHKWKAIEARNAKEFGEAWVEIGLALECIDDARNAGCAEIYVPPKEPLWERVV